MQVEVLDKKLKAKKLKMEKKLQKKMQKKQKKEKYENIMKQCQPTAYSCSAHSDDFLRLVPQPSKNPPICKSCGFKCSGVKGYLACPKTSGCFTLCSTCRVCTSNHPLRKMNSLKHQEKNDALFGEDKFNCHGCKKVCQVGSNGCWHCSKCVFTICWPCYQRSEQLWQIESQEECQQELQKMKVE